MAARNYLAINNIKAINFDLSVWGQYAKACPESFSQLQSYLAKKGIKTNIIATVDSALVDLENDLDLSADEILYVGTKQQDIQHANKAGMISVLVNDKQNLRFGQQFSISSVDQLLDYF
jgi:phosphoglycolate phosphatase-like HAD superfamily hydrolase